MHLIDFHFLSTHNIAHFVIQRWYMVSPFTAVFKMRYNFSALNWQGVYKQILTHIEKCSFYYLKSMVFENHPKSRIWIFQFWHFPPILSKQIIHYFWFINWFLNMNFPAKISLHFFKWIFEFLRQNYLDYQILNFLYLDFRAKINHYFEYLQFLNYSYS